MKKIKSIILFAAISFTNFLFSQTLVVNQIDDWGETSTIDISGTTLNLSLSSQALTNGYDATNLYIKNVSNTTKSVFVQRTILSEPNGWNDFLCWGRAYSESDPLYENICYYSETMEETIWTSLSVTIPVDSGAQLVPKVYIGESGSACYKYVFISENVHLDSITVCFSKTTSILENEEISFETYPNPANKLLHLSFLVNNESNLEYLLTDLSGKMIEKKLLENNQIDISKIESGVYFISIQRDQTVLSTKRFIINK